MSDEEKRSEAESETTDETTRPSAAEGHTPSAESAVAPSNAELADAVDDAEDMEAAAMAGMQTKMDDPHAGHADDHDHGGGHGHGADHFAHILPMPILIGVLGALILLTILTVGVTAIDLGTQGNFIFAMIIATVKAGLVMAYFMHMVWDSKFNVVAFTSSFLFVLLFLAMSTLDRSEYGDNIDHWEADHKTDAMK